MVSLQTQALASIQRESQGDSVSEHLYVSSAVRTIKSQDWQWVWPYMEDERWMREAVAEAIKGRDEGGIPIGSVLVVDGNVLGRGHNQRVQHNSVIHHAEMNALENAGRLRAATYARATLYSTLSPCPMCSGAALLYGIKRIVAGENRTFQGPEEYLRSQGVEVVVQGNEECERLMAEFITAKPELWNEDIGV